VHPLTFAPRPIRTSEAPWLARYARDEARSPEKALVLLQSLESPRGAPSSNVRGYAPFITQLIATRDKLPQARQRRRATVERAIARYRAAQVLRTCPSRSDLGSA
jgi:hypothetical protein